MTRVHAVIVASVVVISANPLAAQELSRYRTYALESSVASVARLSGAREADAKTAHERPAKIQELSWRSPSVRWESSNLADPVHDVIFSFYNDQLYQVVVNYDRDRMNGLTNDDVIESLSATYGVPLLSYVKLDRTDWPSEARSDTPVVARWESSASLLTLTRGTYSSLYQLVLISKALNGRALAAVEESTRLDKQEAPQREIDNREKDAAAASVVTQKARVVNKAAFRP